MSVAQQYREQRCISAALDPEDKQKIQKLSKITNLSVSEVIRSLIKNSLKELSYEQG